MEKIVRIPVASHICEVDFKQHLKKDLVTWWYRSLSKGKADSHQPKVLVCFRELDSNDCLTDNFFHIQIGITELGQFRIGTIWRDKTCQYQVKMDVEVFQVDFDPDAWHYYSIAEEVRNGRHSHIPIEVYPLHQAFEHDKTWMLQFPFSGGSAGLFLPCTEFFSRCYGRSQHVKRVLSTYPWPKAKDELLAPLVEPAEPGSWTVNLKKRAVNGDVVLLAHLSYDNYAAKQAQSIWTQLEAAQGPYGSSPVFPRIGPWFKGAARLKVKGVWIEKGKSFLGLEIIGCSDPNGVPIFRDRENTAKTGPISESAQKGKAWAGVPPTKVKALQQIVNATSSEMPDSGSGSVEIDDPTFEVLGTPRVVVDIRRKNTNSTKGAIGKDEQSNRYSGDEKAGNGKGVGYASYQAKTEMESQGVLRDVWNMLKLLQSMYPKIICKVEFLTAVGGDFSSDDEPTLIGFEAFNKLELASKDEHGVNVVKDAKWPYLNKNGVIRGALLAKVSTPNKDVYFFEIQRKLRVTKAQEPEGKLVEESFRGLVFLLNNADEVHSWVSDVLDQARYTAGVLTKVVASRPGKAFLFKHVPTNAEQYPQQSSILRALSLVGVDVPLCTEKVHA